MNCAFCTFLNASSAKICEICFKSLHSEKVMDENSGTDEDSLDATNDGTEFYERECELCYGKIGSNYFAMFSCTHIFCNDCAVNYFTHQITHRPIINCVCPICNLPDLSSSNDDHGEYFSLLLASLRPILDGNIMNVFDKKLTEMALISDPNFIWCIGCTSGFVNQPTEGFIDVKCPNCSILFCSKCKKKWERQHLDLSCDEFANWKRDNNPDLSTYTITNILKQNSIECPKCKFKYMLTRGGCIHFTCSQCKHEFCFGCSKPYLKKCKATAYCENLGLHAHHDRNCLVYLRSHTVDELKKLLQDNNVEFIESRQHKNGNVNCPMELQIVTGRDTVCGHPTKDGEAGLCTIHYHEYLAATIRQAKLETSSILKVQSFCELLRYKGIPVPLKSKDQSDIEYRNVCAQVGCKECVRYSR
ncbi:E3 ubiquitin-protein ligase lubel [Pseudolycoriella hygida]|uniref:E3 ubiquitin-protein ligase lubel n=1 Tax=Pseudolycoriella hygida TaxID=35572 RepID=A0A9Q0MKE2_9DIPT|nr:E3 ubiquitin-protein ligase lubel [Pseudolycoriella hygida]